MAGTKNDVLVAKNADFTQVNAPNSSSSESNGLVTDGKLWIGSTALNAGSTHINVGSITSPDNSITVSYSSPNINMIVAGGSTVGKTITGNTGGALNPTLGNWNIVGTGSLTTSGSVSTLTAQLTGLTNHTVLVGAGTATITKVGPGSSGQVLQSGGASADPAYSTATYPSVATGTGKILRADGTNWVATTATYPDTAGTSGNVLTSDGTNWLSTAPVQFQTVNSQVITASGAFTYTPTSGMKYVIVELQGAGGGSGGVAATSANTAGSQAAGAGSYVKFILTAAQVGASKTGSVGASGTAGSAGNNAGGNGGATTLATTSPWSAGGGTGGAGGAAVTSFLTLGAAGGGITTGTGTLTVSVAGGGGGQATGNAVGVGCFAGPGGSSFYGTGGVAAFLCTVSTTSLGSQGQGYGSGGGSALNYGTSNAIGGGAGGPGVAIFTEFCS